MIDILFFYCANEIPLHAGSQRGVSQIYLLRKSSNTCDHSNLLYFQLQHFTYMNLQLVFFSGNVIVQDS